METIDSQATRGNTPSHEFATEQLVVAALQGDGGRLTFD